MKKSNARKSLLMSILAMLFSISMFAGTTFAWFTDSVTSSNNRIVAGNLDVDLVMRKKDTDNNYKYLSIAGGSGDIFNEAENANSSPASLWEPGKTQIVYLGVRNTGTLALKYNVILDVTDEDTTDSVNLADVLDFAIIDNVEYGNTETNYATISGLTKWSTLTAAAEAANAGNVGIIGEAMKAVAQSTTTPSTARIPAAANGVLDEIANTENSVKNETDYFALAVHMQEGAGNEYQGKGIIIDVAVIATQKDAESDSFNDKYDETSILPAAPAMINRTTAKVFSASTASTTTEATVIEDNNAKSTVSAGTTIATAVDDQNQSIDLGELTDTDSSLSRTISTTSESDVVTYDISYKYTYTTVTTDVETGEETSRSTKTANITSFSDFVINELDVGKDLKIVKVTHSHGTATPVEMNLLTEAEYAAANTQGYYYDYTTGILTIISKEYSKFAVEFDNKVPVTEIVLDKTAFNLDRNTSATIIATVLPSTATYSTVTWTSSDETIATVDNTGLVTAKNVNNKTVVITATADGQSATCLVTVVVPVSSIRFPGNTIYETLNETLLLVNETKTLTANIEPSFATDKAVVWSSSDETIVTVSQSGEITAVSTGSAIVTATANNGVKANCTVYVLDRGETSDPVAVVEGEDTILSLGKFTVTVPADAVKTSDTLSLTVKEVTADEAKLANTFGTIYAPKDSLNAYVTVNGISSNNTVPLMVTANVGKGVRDVDVYKGKSGIYGSNRGCDINEGTIWFKTPTLETAPIALGYKIRFNLSTPVELTNGSAVATVAASTFMKIENSDDLKLIVTETVPNSEIGYDTETKRAIAYIVDVEGVASGSVTFTIPTGDKVSEVGRDFILYNGASKFDEKKGTFDLENREMNFSIYFTDMNPMPPYYITMVYTVPNAAELAAIQAIDELGEDEVLVITSPVEDEMIDLANLASDLSKNGITITGHDKNLATVVKSTYANIKANDLTFKDIKVYSGNATANSSMSGLTLTGNNVKVSDAYIEGLTTGYGSSLEIIGSNTEIKNTTITKTGSATNRYGGLELESDTATSVTTIDNVNFQGTDGLLFRSFAGRINITNSTFDVSNSAIQLNMDSGPNTGSASFTDCTIKAKSIGFMRVGNGVTFENTTFKTPSGTGNFTIKTGDNVTTNITFKGCTFMNELTFPTSTTNGFKTEVTFEDCTYLGETITEDNIQNLFNFTAPNTYQVEKTYNGTTFTITCVKNS